jgi:hypothetical protein
MLKFYNLSLISEHRYECSLMISSVYSHIFGNKMCKTWSKQLENRSIWALSSRNRKSVDKLIEALSTTNSKKKTVSKEAKWD